MANHPEPPYHPNLNEISATCPAIEATTPEMYPWRLPRKITLHHQLHVHCRCYWTLFKRCLERMNSDMENLWRNHAASSCSHPRKYPPLRLCPRCNHMVQIARRESSLIILDDLISILEVPTKCSQRVESNRIMNDTLSPITYVGAFTR